MTTDHELEEALRIARIAERHVRSIHGTPYAVELEAPGDPVTRADREASDLICAALAASFPGDAILSEERVPAGPGEVARLVGADLLLRDGTVATHGALHDAVLAAVAAGGEDAWRRAS